MMVYQRNTGKWSMFYVKKLSCLHHISVSCNDRLIAPQKKGRIYEVGHYIDIQSKMDEMSQKMDHRVDELSQRIDRMLNMGHSPTLPISSVQQEVCTICSSSTHYLIDSLATTQFSKFVYEQVQQAQAQ